MLFSRSTWLRITSAAAALNVAAGAVAYVGTEHVHAYIHGGVALIFGIWALKIRGDSDEETDSRLDNPDRVEMLEANLSELETELLETRKRLEFADQLLKNKPPKQPAPRSSDDV